MDVNEELFFIQDEINRLAYDIFAGISGYEEYSVPCIPRISPQYLKNRFVLLAQETNTWYPNQRFQFFSSSEYENLEKILYEERYDNFCQWASDKYSGPLWEFTRTLYKEKILSGPLHEDKYLTHCWMNLFCIEKCKNKNDRNGRPSQKINLAKEVLKIQRDLVFRILSVIKPRLILATTGHKNDRFLIEKGFGTTRDKVEILPVDENGVIAPNYLAKIKIKDVNNPLYGAKIIRSYHPNFFLTKINREDRLIDFSRNLKEKGLKMSKMEYYKSCLLDVLKKLCE